MKFIKIENVLLDPYSKYHLTVNELFVLILMKSLSNQEKEAAISAEFLHQYLEKKKFGKLHSRKSENKRRILDCVSSLKKKDVILVDGDMSNSNEVLLVNFLEDLSDEKTKGFEKLYYKELYSMLDRNFLYIYLTISKHQKSQKTTFDASYEKWGEILGVSRSTAIRLLEKCISQKIIFSNSGAYLTEEIRGGQLKQYVNQYSTKPFFESMLPSENSSKQSGAKKTSIDYGNWYNNSKLTTEDYVIFKTLDDNNFQKHCETRIENTIAKHPWFKQKHEKLMQEAQDIINKEQDESVNALIRKVGDVILKTDKGILSFNEYNNEDIKGFWYFKEVNRFAPEINDTVPENVLEFNNNFLDIDEISAFRPKSADLWKNENDDPFAGLN